MHHPAILAVEERALASAGVIDQLVRQHQIAGDMHTGDGAYRRDGQNGVDVAVLQRPQIGAIIDAMRRNRVPMTVPRQKYHVLPRHLAEDQRRRGFAVGGADDLAVGNGKRRQSGEPAAANDGQHGSFSAGTKVSVRRPSGKDPLAVVPVVTLLELGYSCQFMTLSSRAGFGIHADSCGAGRGCATCT